jgi:hypothetical protein
VVLLLDPQTVVLPLSYHHSFALTPWFLLAMKGLKSLLSLAAALPAVRGMAFGGPAPTAAILKRNLDPALPRPTIPPSNHALDKRQTNANSGTCGWVDGIYGVFPCLLGPTSAD